MKVRNATRACSILLAVCLVAVGSPPVGAQQKMKLVMVIEVPNHGVPLKSSVWLTSPASKTTLEASICCRIEDGQLFNNARLDCNHVASRRAIYSATFILWGT